MVFSPVQRLGLLVAFALIVIFRLPHAWVHGRFQDEEATVFFAYAWHFPWQDALFRSFAGYWNLSANATTLIAVKLVRSGILPLERAPYFTMIVALGFQLLPAVLILTGKAQWLAGRLAMIAALMMIAIMPATEEVFFNVLHIQFHLALCAALILALDVPDRRAARVGYGLLLFLAPLCGPGAIVILPLFALRAFVDHDRRRLNQLVALAAGAAVQLLFFYGHSPVRARVLGPGTIAAAIFVRMIALPFVGIPFAFRTGTLVYTSQVDGGHGWWLFAGAAAVCFGALTILTLQRRDGAIWMILAALSIAVASLGVGMISIRPDDAFRILGSERYNFLPNVLIGLGMVTLAARPAFRGRLVYATLCGLMIFIGVLNYPKPIIEFADGPSWPAEVQAWRTNHDRRLAVWPRPWAVDLSDRTRPCSPPTRDPGQSNDPRYCESGWLAGFYSRH